jgi:hypothetical protein
MSRQFECDRQPGEAGADDDDRGGGVGSGGHRPV